MHKLSLLALVAAMSLSVGPLEAAGFFIDKAANTAPAVAAPATELKFSASIPTIMAVDSSMDEAALRDAILGGIARHSDELAALNAKSITIPEITLDYSAPLPDGMATDAKVTFRDVTLTDVVNGVAASASIGAMSSSSTKSGNFELGTTSATNLDFGGLLAMYGSNGSAEAPLKSLYSNLSWGGGTFSDPTTNCTFGKASVADFKARPLKVSVSALIDAAKAVRAGGADPSPETMGLFVGFYTDLFQALESTPMTLDGLACSGTSEDGKPFAVKIGGIVADGYSRATYPGVTMTDLSISGNDGSITLANLTLKPTDLSAPIAALEAAAGSLDKAWFDTNYRKIIPAFGGFALSGLSVDVPDTDHAGQRIKVRLDNFDVTLSDYMNGIPSRISATGSGVDVPLPADSSDETIKQLLAMGLTHVEFGYELAAHWDQPGHAIKIDKIAIAGANLATFTLAATIGNAIDEIFSIDPNVALVALMGVTVKDIQINVGDEGLADLIVPMAAGQQGIDPVAFRTQMAGVAEGAVLSILGSTDTARTLGAAIGNFVGGKAKALAITITANDPAGLTVPVLMQASENPALLASQVTITGEAH